MTSHLVVAANAGHYLLRRHIWAPWKHDVVVGDDVSAGAFMQRPNMARKTSLAPRLANGGDSSGPRAFQNASNHLKRRDNVAGGDAHTGAPAGTAALGVVAYSSM